MADNIRQLEAEVCLLVCGDNEDKLYSDNLVSGFRKCGIVPINRNEVLSLLPQQEPSGTNAVNENDTNAAAVTVSDAVLQHLKTMRLNCDINPKVSFSDCWDWKRYRLPCKHILAVIMLGSGCQGWQSLPEFYRDIPQFNLDPHTVQPGKFSETTVSANSPPSVSSTTVC